MVARALQLWQEYEQKWNVKLFFRSGALRMAGADDSYESAALPVLKDAGIRFEKLSVPDCAKRWPQINFDGVSLSVYEPDSGFLAARRGCEAVLHELTEPKPILRHLADSLKPGGCLVIVDRGPRSGPVESREKQEEHHELRLELIETEVRTAGFEIVNRQDHFIDRPADDQIWWLLVAGKR